MRFKRRLLTGAAILPDRISEALMQAERSIIARLEANGAYVIREFPSRAGKSYAKRLLMKHSKDPNP